MTKIARFINNIVILNIKIKVLNINMKIKFNKNEEREVTLKGISHKEIKIIAELEFHEKRYFRREDIKHLFKNKKEMTNVIYNLVKKGRFVRLNKNKYFLVPMKARMGKGTDEPFIIIDEALDGKDYFIGGWGAANYWRLTDQIPFRYDVYTTRRQGTYEILGVKIIFHRTTKERIKKAVVKQLNNHSFYIMSKKEMKKWIKLRE